MNLSLKTIVLAAFVAPAYATVITLYSGGPTIDMTYLSASKTIKVNVVNYDKSVD